MKTTEQGGGTGAEAKVEQTYPLASIHIILPSVIQILIIYGIIFAPDMDAAILMIAATVGYWVGIGMALSRRRNTLRASDVSFIRVGLILCFFLSGISNVGWLSLYDRVKWVRVLFNMLWSVF